MERYLSDRLIDVGRGLWLGRVARDLLVHEQGLRPPFLGRGARDPGGLLSFRALWGSGILHATRTAGWARSLGTDFHSKRHAGTSFHGFGPTPETLDFFGARAAS